MELTVLGCGDAFGNGGRYHTAFLVTDEKEHVLLDCGASTLIRLKEESIALEAISTIVLSHFHGDHFGGLPFFMIASMFETPRKAPLTIVGPKGVKEKVYALQEAMYPGTSEYFDELDLHFATFEEGTPVTLGNKTIHAYEVDHSPPSLPHAIRLAWDGKVISFSGDTSWTDKLIPLAEGADVFICECNFMDKVSFGHLSLKELEEKKALLNCRQLWLTHMNDEVYSSNQVSFDRLTTGLKLKI